jgi:hypothetical protein
MILFHKYVKDLEGGCGEVSGGTIPIFCLEKLRKTIKVCQIQGRPTDIQIGYILNTNLERPYIQKIEGKGKAYPLLNQAPRHEDAWGSRDRAPRILNFGTKWR